jgi:hypothetical protein
MPVPTTAGMPYSRATIAACDMVPPMSDTRAAILPKTGPQLGAVHRADEDLALADLADVVDVRSTRATPLDHPGEAAYPRLSTRQSSPPSQVSTVSW